MDVGDHETNVVDAETPNVEEAQYYEMVDIHEVVLDQRKGQPGEADEQIPPQDPAAREGGQQEGAAPAHPECRERRGGEERPEQPFEPEEAGQRMARDVSIKV